MKKIITLITTLLISAGAHSALFTEGKQYKELDTQASAKPIVTEYFSFYCPHCLRFEPIMEQIKQNLPDTATFEKIHVSFMGGNMGVSMAKAYATMVMLKVEHKMIPAMFTQIHSLRKRPHDDAALRQVFINQGIDAKAFDAAFNSFAVSSMQQRYDISFKGAQLHSVPSVIVNNKYLVTPDKSIKTVEDYMALINFLLKQPS
jgi:thiol:disulfide interchange protein DsbA